MSDTAALTPTVRTRLTLPSGIGRGNVALVVGLVILAVIVAAALAAPLLTRWDPIEPDPLATLLPPSGEHLFGTDNLGRDIFTRVLYGARSDLTLASVAVLAPFVIGLAVGILCGYVGGWFDVVVMRVADIVTAFPFFILVISLVFVLGGGVWTIFIAITAVSWVAYARIVRAETMVLRNTEFVAASRVGGISTARIMTRHIAPNVLTQAIVYAMSDIVMNVGVIVTLSYFGLGIVPPTPDWGAMMADGQQFLAADYYGLTLFPAAAVVLTSLALALVGEGLAHVLRIER
ncbi:ABC transporter permease [Terracoccus luteus]|jgi:peptide/nickel transport system permease protein|uniref:Peptide/nickel transport system permease protein n=1 Tax=Terracoccus luteus TaxID=53356 RepID=A0A495XXP1_9MICO|nr:ABC transporter permease [Terracoccus luteus]MBB2986610.1 peptide/nickel transport system permease protein [Terracoccus luteus]MCP2171801.1 peptide/nickel transport system permease protein [Terracoccus luteus]RKT79360.1 peptide/nickel transport system permease protein [Terracoccus luteus]